MGHLILRLIVGAESVRSRPPLNHVHFSRLPFVRGLTSTTELADDSDILQADKILLEEDSRSQSPAEHVEKSEAEQGGWLESDDIEEF